MASAAAAAGLAGGGGGGSYALSPPLPPPLHVTAGMGSTFHEQLRYRDAQIAKLAGEHLSCVTRDISEGVLVNWNRDASLLRWGPGLMQCLEPLLEVSAIEGVGNDDWHPHSWRAGTLAHYRAWAQQVQARYQMFNAEAARPARRIYVGGLPASTQEVYALNDSDSLFSFVCSYDRHLLR